MMLAMQGSASEDSYAENSSLQNHHFHSFAKPRLGDAIQHLLRETLHPRALQASCHNCEEEALRQGILPHLHIAIADLGCSYGRNTLDCAEFVLSTLEADLVFCKDDAPSRMEIQYFFSDLPSNDFNALFQSLQPYLQQSDFISVQRERRTVPKIFAAGVPGSFYGRLFPSRSLDLVICSYSLHWISQVPPSLVDKASPEWNGGHTWLSNTRPPKDVVTAYARQSKNDVQSCLRSRAHELTRGGILFLFWPARTPEPGPQQKGFTSLDSTMELFDYAWRELVAEGLIAQEEMDMFNMPLYYFNQEELEGALKDLPELEVLHMETKENMALFPEQGDRTQAVEQWVRLFSSILKPTMEAHLGKHKVDELFKRLKAICSKQECFDIVITLNLGIASLQCVLGRVT